MADVLGVCVCCFRSVSQRLVYEAHTEDTVLYRYTHSTHVSGLIEYTLCTSCSTRFTSVRNARLCTPAIFLIEFPLTGLLCTASVGALVQCAGVAQFHQFAAGNVSCIHSSHSVSLPASWPSVLGTHVYTPLILAHQTSYYNMYIYKHV